MHWTSSQSFDVVEWWERGGGGGGVGMCHHIGELAAKANCTSKLILVHFQQSIEQPMKLVNSL